MGDSESDCLAPRSGRYHESRHGSKGRWANAEETRGQTLSAPAGPVSIELAAELDLAVHARRIMELPSTKSLSKLLLGAWIDNDVVNTYCHLLQQHSENVKIVDSFFFSKLRFHGVERARASFKVTAAFN